MIVGGFFIACAYDLITKNRAKRIVCAEEELKWQEEQNLVLMN